LLRGPDGVNSSAAVGALFVGAGIVIGSRLPGRKAIFARSGTLVVIAVVTFAVLQSTLGIIEMIVASLGRNMTFTDRVPMWNKLVDIGLQSPFLGYGYSGFWTEDRVAAISAVAGDFTQGHNGYLELFVEGGFVAIGLLLAMIVVVFRKIQRTDPAVVDFGILRLSLFVIVLLANITESAFARERDLLSFVFFVIAMNDQKLGSLVRSATRALPGQGDEPVRTPAKTIPRWQGDTATAARRPVPARSVQRSVFHPHTPPFKHQH
jgi:O-antigen ligase